MMESKFDTRSVASVSPVDAATTPAVAPTLVTQATQEPLGVLVRNVSLGATIFLAFDSGVLMNIETPQAARFVLPAGISETVILAPGQKLYASTPSPDPAEMSIHIFEVALTELIGRR